MNTLIIGVPAIILIAVILYKVAQAFSAKSRKPITQVIREVGVPTSPKGPDEVDPADYREALDRAATRQAYRAEHELEAKRIQARRMRERVQDFLEDPTNQDALKRYVSSSSAPVAPTRGPDPTAPPA